MLQISEHNVKKANTLNQFLQTAGTEAMGLLLSVSSHAPSHGWLTAGVAVVSLLKQVQKLPAPSLLSLR